MAAMVAGEPPGEAMLDHPGGAIGALEAIAAMAAEGERRVAAAVEEEQALLARLEIFLERADQDGASQRPRGGGSCSMSIAAMSGRRAPP